MESKSSQRRLKAQRRRDEAWKLRIAGYSITEIARMLGVSIATASDDVSKSYDEWRKQCEQEACEMARLDLKRLEVILHSLMPAIEKGCHKSAAVAIRVLERRAKMLGHDAIQRVEVTTGEDSLEEIKERIKEALGDT